MRRLKFNKLNIPARNLLGLVYYEMGEAVSALSEWIISKNFQRKDNLASDYIERLQKEANKLDSINLSIKKFNEALRCCREGNEDVAVIQLKKGSSAESPADQGASLAGADLYPSGKV